MKTIRHYFCVLSLCLIYSNFSYASVFHAQANGDWDVDATWLEAGVPGQGDDVIIDGYTVTVNSKILVNNILLTNATASNAAKLIIEGTDTLTVLGNVIVTAEDVNEDVDFVVRGFGTLIVKGNVDFSRSADNSESKLLRLYLLENSKTYFEGDFVFDYKNAGSESDYDIFTQDDALFDVSGKTTLITRDGKDLDFILNGFSQVIFRDSLKLLLLGGQETAITADQSSHFQLLGHAYLLNSGGSNHTKLKAGDSGGTMTINGNISMESTASALDVKLEAKGATSQFNVIGNINMDAFDQQDVHIHVRTSGKFYLGGDIIRETAFGYLLMEYDGQFIFNGTSVQTIPKSNLLGSGTDAFDFSDVLLQNTSGQPIKLAGDMSVSEELIFTDGGLLTADTALLIIEDNATITGAGPDAYVQGPMMKRGRSSAAFVFPIGDGTTYSPMTISQITNSSYEYTAQYFEDPPPFGNLEGKVEEVSNSQYWTLEKSVGAKDVDITLHWMNTQDQGFSDLDSLLVVGLNGSGKWQSFGNGGTTGTTGVNNTGSIITLGDPPPFGIINFTIGSTDLGSLPIELTRFQVVQENDEVYMQWQTVSEINSSHFIVERSLDGHTFEQLTTVWSRGEGSGLQTYSAKDLQPYYGYNFYRLKMVDNDGSFEYSPIEVVEFAIVPAVSIYPNPVSDLLNLEINDSKNSEGIMEVFDRNGKRIYAGKVSFENGNYRTSADAINVFTPGTYIIKIMLQSENQVLKFIKIY